ncbi:MAG: AI-2E family transporter [Burkholderiales bacterium]|jgi:predicted PurR-regulated permease PerM|nr:AI-2E family transporter [Burkholderiales bacterium]
MPVDDAGNSGAAAQPAAAGVIDATGRGTSVSGYSCMNPALIMLAVIALVAALYFARAFFVPLLIGILASYSLRPMVDRLQALHVPRSIAAALVIGALAGGTGWIAYSLSDEAAAMLEKLPDAARKLRHTLSPARSAVPTALQNMQEAADELQGVAADAARKPGARAAPAPAPDTALWLRDYTRAQSALLISVVAQTPIVILLAYFLLASGDHFRRKLLQFVGSSLSRKKDALRILGEIDDQVQRYLFVTLVSNALIAVSTWLAFWAMGVDEPGIWGVAAGVLHFIPYLGSVLVAIAAGVAGFLQFGTLPYALAVAGVTLLVATLIGLVLTTWLQSRFARVNAAVLFIALLFFGWLWGVAGLLLCAPLVAISKVICDRVESLQPAGELLGR